VNEWVTDRIVEYLSGRSFEEVNAHDLAAWMERLIKSGEANESSPLGSL